MMIPLRSVSLPFIVAACCLSALPTLAEENETVPAFALRGRKSLSANTNLDVQYTIRWREAFNEQERSIFQLGINTSVNNWEYAAGYNQHFDRSVPGKEHRLWQQIQYEFTLESGSVESSARVEERYFPDSDASGERLRVLNRWKHPLPGANELRLGHEWVYNLNDIGASTRRGTSQNRLLAGISHTLAAGRRVEFEYQLRYLHVPALENLIQHQLQLTYAFPF